MNKPEVTLPHSIEAEQALLGGMISYNEKIPDALHLLQEIYFFLHEHKLIFSALKDVFEKQGNVSWVDISNSLYIHQGKQESAYLKELSESTYPQIKLYNYCIILKENYLLREIYRLGEFCQQVCFLTDGKTVQELLSSIEEKVYPLSLLTQDVEEYTSLHSVLSDSIDEFVNPERKFKPLETPFNSLNKYECFHKSALTLVASRPGVGKTSFMLNVITHISHTESVLFISLENEASKIGADLFSINTNIAGGKLKTRTNLTSGDFDKLMDYLDDTRESHLFIRDIPTCNINTLHTVYHSLNSKLLRENKPPVGMVIIDYIGLMKSPDTSKTISLYQQMTELSRDLKIFAMKYQISVVGICQLNREVDKRADKIPQLSDLRDSGSLEQDADSVLMLYKNPESPADKLNLFIAKNRHGTPYHTLEFDWNGECKKISELSNIIHIDTNNDYKKIKIGDK